MASDYRRFFLSPTLSLFFSVFVLQRAVDFCCERLNEFPINCASWEITNHELRARLGTNSFPSVFTIIFAFWIATIHSSLVGNAKLNGFMHKNRVIRERISPSHSLFNASVFQTAKKNSFFRIESFLSISLRLNRLPNDNRCELTFFFLLLSLLFISLCTTSHGVSPSLACVGFSIMQSISRCPNFLSALAHTDSLPDICEHRRKMSTKNRKWDEIKWDCRIQPR